LLNYSQEFTWLYLFRDISRYFYITSKNLIYSTF
jgi:hypothetical protein